MIIVTVMAVLGIGGGFAILAREYYREHRQLRYARWLCANSHACVYTILGLPGLTRGPNWRAERLRADAIAWNRELAARRARILRDVERVRVEIARAELHLRLRRQRGQPDTTLVPPDRRVN